MHPEDMHWDDHFLTVGRIGYFHAYDYNNSRRTINQEKKKIHENTKQEKRGKGRNRNTRKGERVSCIHLHQLKCGKCETLMELSYAPLKRQTDGLESHDQLLKRHVYPKHHRSKEGEALKCTRTFLQKSGQLDRS